jgi:hypothetical protein
MIFGNNPKTFCPSKVLGAFCPGITAAKIWFFEKPKTKPVLVYPQISRDIQENIETRYGELVSVYKKRFMEVMCIC